MYRDGDFEQDYDVQSTASCFEGLKEDNRYLPGDVPKMRRASSAGDVSRFHRHYDLARRHCGRSFTWRHYASLLRQELLVWSPPTLNLKPTRSVFTVRSSTSAMSERSAYVTAIESDGSSSYSAKKIKSQASHLAMDLVKRVDRLLNLHPSRVVTPSPTVSKKRRLAKTKGNTTPSLGSKGGRSSDLTNSDSESSVCSIPRGAGDSGTPRRRMFRFK